MRFPWQLTSLLGCSLSVWGGVALAAPQAPEPTRAEAEVTEVVAGLNHPWALAFLPDGSMLITERSGTLRRLDPQMRLSAPLQGLPEIAVRGQGGLLDIALSPNFAEDRWVYLSYAESDGNKMGTAMGRGRLSEDASRLDDFSVLFRQEPKLSTGHHFGSRIVFAPDGFLYLALGENNQRATAQDLGKLQGKVVRLHPDGRIPDNNPFIDNDEARPEIWSYGHRNPQGFALNPWTQELWLHEHGPRGGDEINHVQAGLNYGWPLATYGINYTGFSIPEAEGTTVEGTEPPLLWWKRSPAISGMAFYDADRFTQWGASLFIGALRSQELIRLTLDGKKVLAEERLLHDRGDRIRDVRVGPDGYVYVLTDSPNGALLRIAPKTTP
ncbi:MAG TPA: PQQ-dependent sugar dehydrogenase [Paenalcaligenes sp.]|nr:PQQ-dependent sugar dehydrogenase [Paenalcaligenes sp.]